LNILLLNSFMLLMATVKHCVTFSPARRDVTLNKPFVCRCSADRLVITSSLLVATRHEVANTKSRYLVLCKKENLHLKQEFKS
jgi:hypothetical protein